MTVYTTVNLRFLPARRSKRVICYGNVAGWLAGCPSHAGIKTAKTILKLFRPSGSPIILVSSDSCADSSPSAGALNTRGWENWRFSTEIAVYLGNGAR